MLIVQANETAGKIDSALTCNTESNKLGRAAEASFREIADFTHRYNAKVAEIKQAMEQSAAGLGQINTALSRLDRSAQNVAAASEENASASQLMVAQANTLNGHIAVLEGMTDNHKAPSLTQAEPHSNTTLPTPRADHHRSLEAVR